MCVCAVEVEEEEEEEEQGRLGAPSVVVPTGPQRWDVTIEPSRGNLDGVFYPPSHPRSPSSHQCNFLGPYFLLVSLSLIYIYTVFIDKER